MIFEDHIIKISINDKLIPEFFQAQTKTKFFRNQMIQKSNTATMTTINQKSLLSCNIILPTIEEQQIFVQKSEYINEKLNLLKKSFFLYEDLYNSLMQKAFKGELF